MTDLPLKSSLTHNVLHIWDSNNPAPKGDWTTVLWSQHADKDDPSQVSIADVVEEKSDELKALYLAWIHDLGEAEIDGKRIIDHLSIRPGFSYWWTTSLAQKFNCSGKSQINNAIKALALESFYAEGAFESIVLNTDNMTLAHVISEFCKKKKINFEFHKLKPAKKFGRSNLLLNSLPGSIVALIYLLRYLYRTLPLYFINRSNVNKSIGEVMFFDVLVHLDKQAFNDGIFRSNYWTKLVDKLHQDGIKSNWVHLFFKHPAVSTLTKARRLTDRFTFSSEANEFHTLLERPLTIKMLFTVVSDFFKIRKSLSKLKGIAKIRPAGSDINLWSFHEFDWRRSLCGIQSIDVCLKLNLFAKKLAEIPKQRLGFYIAENQPWEMILIHAWNLNGHGKLVGVPHTTIRYWDLRYFYYFRTYKKNKINDLPMPNLLAVNGPVARETMLLGGYPLEKIVDVEALRFLDALKKNDYKMPKKNRQKFSVLVCGDFLESTNQVLLEWVYIASKSLNRDIEYIFKPHPAYPLKSNKFKGLNIKFSDKPLYELFVITDFVFTSNITSAAVEAYFFDVPVAQMLDGNDFNISPLRGLYNVKFVKNANELSSLLKKPSYKRPFNGQPYFWFDERLVRWNKLLALK
jgi:surface carbohydrate biosynthesis protein (TIGR04326 family)